MARVPPEGSAAAWQLELHYADGSVHGWGTVKESCYQTTDRLVNGCWAAPRPGEGAASGDGGGTARDSTAQMRNARGSKCTAEPRPLVFVLAQAVPHDSLKESAAGASASVDPAAEALQHVGVRSKELEHEMVLLPVDRRRKMAKLGRTLGQNVPPELVFSAPSPAKRPNCDGATKEAWEMRVRNGADDTSGFGSR
ncbi:hypothetical protein FB451DRAFT_1172221 [Mycena latifolia]|nr:hypothetical protein FB451DRAFT_1172221 [Mycena latifolia]